MSDKQVNKIETGQHNQGANPDDEEKSYKVGPPVQSNVCSKECFSCGGIFPHTNGER